MNKVLLCEVRLHSGESVFVLIYNIPSLEDGMYKFSGIPASRNGESRGKHGTWIFNSKRVDYIYCYPVS